MPTPQEYKRLGALLLVGAANQYIQATDLGRRPLPSTAIRRGHSHSEKISNKCVSDDVTIAVSSVEHVAFEAKGFRA